MIDYQLIAIFILFFGAVFYIGRFVFLSLSAKKGCGSSCKCSVDFSKNAD
jgi:hypothetical protein